MTSDQPSRRVAFAVTVLVLILLGSLLGMALLLSMQRAASADGEAQDAWTRLALLCVALLALTLVLLVGVVVRRIGRRFSQRKSPRQPTRYVDAWREAGRRIEVPDEEDTDTQRPDDL